VTSKERFFAALEFRTPDRIPRCDYFIGDFPDAWRRYKGFDARVDPMDDYGIDITEVVGDESFMPSRVRKLSEDNESETWVDGWGVIKRVYRSQTYFIHQVGAVLENPAELDRLEFDPVTEPSRFAALPGQMARHQRVGRFVMAKSGGIYIRSHFLRGEGALLMDMALDEAFCEALFDKVADHLTRMSIETLRHTGTLDNGLLVCDDLASNHGPMFSPAMFERYFAPRYQRLIETVKAAGCKHVYFHSDGNILPVLDLLVAAGFEAFNPLEPRCGLDAVRLRAKYGKKVLLIGGVCNTRILPCGSQREIEAHVRPLLEMGRDGGLVLGAASISGDVPPESYEFYHRLCLKYGVYR
jgi:uroporphyrinogen decarboxylase